MASLAKVDKLTREWIRNASDERAALRGYRFDGERASETVDWIQRYCYLYEGDRAGERMILGDWQLDATMRLFGWVKYSEEWSREIRRFRKAGIWIPKKNGKSPTLAAWGLYTFCGDGEMGQKVFSCAKDGRQAMISHQHAIEMVNRSDELRSECTINKSTGQITHEETRSFYKVVAGDNPNSQEGLNGSVMVDETHVVDRRLMSILSRAGISRSEPLHIEVSTAGKNPDGYGKSQFDYGRKVASGEIENDNFLYIEYSAPQDLADADLEDDPMKFGKAANPTWGRIVRPTEYLQDYQESKKSLTDLSDFKTYRLNVWQSSDSPWLRSGDWALCKSDFTESDLLGKTCAAGLDLSKTNDMSALVLSFPQPNEEVWLLPFFWMPEEAARDKNHLAPYLQWAKAGYLALTPGRVVDYGFIKSEFRRLAKMFNITELAYDRTYAEELTQTLSEGQSDSSGKIIEEGTGVERYEFPQTIMAFAGPTKDFERMVINGKLRHNGHPVLTWQAGHVQVRSDVNKNIRPVKPPHGDAKKIDGIVASIMSIARSTQMKPNNAPMLMVW